MKTIFKSLVVAIALVFMLIGDIPPMIEQYVPPLFEQIVPEAQAVFGTRRRTRRRTAVVAYSAGKASATSSQQAATAQQQEATAQQQAETAQQQSVTAKQQAAAQSSQSAPVGTVVQTLPSGCTAVVVSGKSYSNCGGVLYRTAFQGNNLVYVVVEKPSE